jgi:aspartyl-tRNA(Asn)/glutamyl-tRNA(Gln) amidotransferase subunit A
MLHSKLNALATPSTLRPANIIQDSNMRSLQTIRDALLQGTDTPTSLIRQALERIADPAGEGARAFIRVNAESALKDSAQSDLQQGLLAGIPISIKDLFDVQGETTAAGSKLLSRDAPAVNDAPAIARLRAAGAIFIGRTNMTEFAYGGHGINAHFGTPLNPWDRATGRTPGGSTSGGAVSVADGMAAATIGSDTGGSVRIPAALCGITGFKPTQARVPLDGVFPLSFTRDSVGPLAPSVACCVLLDRIMAGESPTVPPPANIRGLKLGVARDILLDGLDVTVAATFQRTLTRLSAAGATITEFRFPELVEEALGSKRANFSAVEAYALHRERLANHYDEFDPMVAKRLMFGADMLAADYVELIHLRKRIMASSAVTTAPFDAVLSPTIPIVAPALAEFAASEAEFFRLNGLLLRNCAPFNVLDRPVFSLPCHCTGEAPVGLQVIGARGGDARLAELALAIESALATE